MSFAKVALFALTCEHVDILPMELLVRSFLIPIQHALMIGRCNDVMMSKLEKPNDMNLMALKRL